MKIRALPLSVLVLSLVSFLNDLASEMVTPLLPMLIAGSVGGGALMLGIIEGVADAVASFLKLWAGVHSDRLGGRRKPFAVFGYGLSNLGRPLLALAATWPVFLGLRIVDRMGKGIRSAPRDAMLADAIQPENKGLAYGFHRAMDNAGALGGALIAAAVLSTTQLSVPAMIGWSAIPGLCAMALLVFWLKDKPAATPPAVARPLVRLARLELKLASLIGVISVMTLAKASETFIVLRAHELGMSVVESLLLWAWMNLAKSGASLVGGRLADRYPRQRVMQVGWVSFALALLMLAQVQHVDALISAAFFYGLTLGFGEGIEKAVVSERASAEQQGTAFGWYNLALGVAAIPGGVLFGWVWQSQGATSAFALAAGLAGLAIGLLSLWHIWQRQSLFDRT